VVDEERQELLHDGELRAALWAACAARRRGRASARGREREEGRKAGRESDAQLVHLGRPPRLAQAGQILVPGRDAKKVKPGCTTCDCERRRILARMTCERRDRVSDEDELERASWKEETHLLLLREHLARLEVLDAREHRALRAQARVSASSCRREDGRGERASDARA